MKDAVSEIYVVEVNADGDKGYPDDMVVEIAICRVDTDTMTFDSVYHELIQNDPLDMGKSSLDILTDNAGIDARELYLGTPSDEVIADVRRILEGKDTACFDLKETFMKFLINEPWDLTGVVTVMPAVSIRVPPKDKAGADKTLQERIRHSYFRLCPEDPAGIGEGRRALDLAQMTSQMILTLRKNGMY